MRDSGTSDMQNLKHMKISPHMNHWTKSVPDAAPGNRRRFIRSVVNRMVHIEAQKFELQRRDQLLAEFEDHLERGGSIGDWINRYSGPLQFGSLGPNEEENGHT